MLIFKKQQGGFLHFVWKNDFIKNQHFTDNDCTIWAKYWDMESIKKKNGFEEDPKCKGSYWLAMCILCSGGFILRVVAVVQTTPLEYFSSFWLEKKKKGRKKTVTAKMKFQKR